MMEMLSRSSDCNSNISHKYIALALRRLHSYSTPSTGAEYCDENVCLSAQISPKPYIRMSPKFRCMLCDHGSVVLWQNCDNVFLVLQMMSCLHITARNGAGDMKRHILQGQHRCHTVAYNETNSSGGNNR